MSSARYILSICQRRRYQLHGYCLSSPPVGWVHLTLGRPSHNYPSAYSDGQPLQSGFWHYLPYRLSLKNGVHTYVAMLVAACVVPSSPILVTLMEAPGSSETSILTSATRRNIQEDTILHSHRRENLKSHRLSLFRVLLCPTTFSRQNYLLVIQTQQQLSVEAITLYSKV
jgi:hypothetical protein